MSDHFTTIFYRPEMSASTASFSPSSSKPKLMVDHWLKTKRINSDEIESFEPVTRHDLYLAHDPAYVDGVLDCEIENGFGNRDKAVADCLPYTTGSMLAATRHVLEHGGIACSPSSGFHHAHYHDGGGYCTFNGLMVSALHAVAAGAKVGILDCDAHYGDGTEDILRRVKHPKGSIKHHTFGLHFPCGSMVKPSTFYRWLLDAIDDLASCDIVLYQAGADPHYMDPLGGQLDSSTMAKRDMFVFEMLENVAWNFAGGYLRDPDGGLSRLKYLHTNTLIASKRFPDDTTDPV